MSVVHKIKESALKAILDLYSIELQTNEILVNETKPEFEGDYTIVLFAFVKQLKKLPEVLGNEIGNTLIQQPNSIFTSFNIIKGFLNLTISDSFWINFLHSNYSNRNYGYSAKNFKNVMVEYSSPNTNKPLHLGHLRNNFLGWSIAEILKATGNNVTKTCIVNDRGIHICKSMIAWQMFGNGETPSSTKIKGDHFVGIYYVKFNDEYKKQIEQLIAEGIVKDIAEKEAPIMKATQQMLLDWELGKADVIELWKTMNSWVYEGFEKTYTSIGSDFHKTYYESNTYLLGKDIIVKGLNKKVFFRKDDGSIWIDLTDEGLDEKLVLRKDGTSIYITQDLGLAQQKFEEYNYDESIYVIGDEQNYHMKVLKLILQKLQVPYANGVHHLSYGMVELPTGKMKSREGSVVDADDIVEEMYQIAKQKTEELGKVNDFSDEELNHLYKTLGLGALKFFLLRVDPKKKMIFNPEESIEFQGFTAPFIQYTHARIKSILRKETSKGTQSSGALLKIEKEIILQLELFSSVLNEAAKELDPSKLAIYIYNLSKLFNSFYAEHSITNAEVEDKKELRLQLIECTAHCISNGMKLLGIQVPDRM